MELIRLYVQQDNRHWEEVIKVSDLLNRVANLEISGATITHASKMNLTNKTQKKVRTPLAGPARHLYA